MIDLGSRVTVFAIGINKYHDHNLRNLRGAHRDVEKLKYVLIKNHKTSIYNPRQYIELKDPNSAELREKISEYILKRSADNDILVLYFSGHGVAVGRDDFGFCTTDTIVHQSSGAVLPLSVVKFSEVLHSLNTANIIPVIIIDACYSGVVGKVLKIPPIDAITTIQNQIHTIAASTYALLCSCSELEPSLDTPNGGVFSNHLVNILTSGIDKNNEDPSILTLHDVFNELSERVLSTNIDTTPRLYLGPTLPKFPLVLNSRFRIKEISLSPVYISILEVLWNKGKPKEMSPDEIRSVCGNGAYGNHSKLSLEPWQLVETVPNTKKLRKLTKQGELFMQNKIKMPKKISKDPKSKRFIPTPDTPTVFYRDLKKQEK